MTIGNVASAWRTDRAGAICALLATVSLLTNMVLMVVAVDFDVARLQAFGCLYDVDAAAQPLLIASTLFDAFFYLLLAPVALALALSSAAGSRNVRFAQVAGGLVYAAAGAVGALTLTLVWPELFARVAAGDAGAAARFEIITTFVFHTVWHQIGAAAGALWWLAVGIGVWRAHRSLGVVSVALCFLSLAELVATSARLDGLAVPLLNVYLALLPIWTLVTAASLWPKIASRAVERSARR
ncbi:MAG: hypothetical protein Q8O67_17305 [Deltaproteobacteria bacterium]|nr:hypothetical protein [Deltaproteobacteria bacterium]